MTFCFFAVNVNEQRIAFLTEMCYYLNLRIYTKQGAHTIKVMW